MQTLLRAPTLLLASFAASACSSGVIADGTVTGTVVDAARAPAAGVHVRIGTGAATTDAAGRFTIHGVEGASYDASLLAPGTEVPYVYLGLTDPAPAFCLFNQALNPQHDGVSATVSVTLPAADGPTLAATVFVELLDSVSHQTQAADNTAPGPLRSFTIRWAGKTQVEARVHAFQLQIDPATQAPLHYVGYATTTTELVGGSAFAWSVDWKAPPFAEAPLSLSTTVPDGYAVYSTVVSMRTGAGGGGFPVAGSNAPGPDVSVLVPLLDGSSFSAEVSAGDAAGGSNRITPGLAAGKKSIPIDLDPAPHLDAPADGDILGVGSDLAWSGGGEGAPWFYLVPAGESVPAPLYFVAAGDSPASVPDLGALGAPLPHGATYMVGVFQSSLAATEEDLAAHGPFFSEAPGPYTYAYSTYANVTIE